MRPTKKQKSFPTKATNLIDEEDFIVDEEIVDEDLILRQQNLDEYIVVLKDPYMLWCIKHALPGRKVPEPLQGNYTTLGRAERAIKEYKNGQAKGR